MNTKWKIETHDYDFSDVPKEELEACCLYEFARESRAVRKMVGQIRNLPRRIPGAGNIINVASNMIQNQFLILISLASGFPSVGWLDLSEVDKQSLLKLPERITDTQAHIKRISERCPPLVFNFDPGTTTLESAIQSYHEKFPAAAGDPVKIGFIALNLKCSDETAFIEAFTRNLKSWLNREPDRGWRALQRPFAPTPRRLRPPGRHSFRDPLNALGAMRLRACYATFTEAQGKMKPPQSKNNVMYYSYRKDFNRACETGLHRFRELSWLFGNPPSERPIHYTKGWEK